MRLLVLGSTGRTGSELVQQGLAAGHEVTAFARNPKAVTINSPLLHVAQGDLFDISGLKQALRRQDAVLIAVATSPFKQSDHFWKQTAQNIIAAMRQAPVGRAVVLSSFLTLTDQLSPKILLATKTALKQLSQDVSASEHLWQHSGLDWTIVHATRLTDGSRGRIRLLTQSEIIGTFASIPRATVAHYMLSILDDKALLQQEVSITSD